MKHKKNGEEKMKFRVLEMWKLDKVSGTEENIRLNEEVKFSSDDIMDLVSHGYEVRKVNGLYGLERIEKLGLSEIVTYVILEAVG